MTHALETFFSAWQETDADTRRALITQAFTQGGAYCDPRSGKRLTSVGEISDYVGMFAANAPGWSASVVKTDDVNGFHRALIAFGGPGPDGSVMTQHGTYFGETDADGKLKYLAGFVGVATAQ